MTGVQFPMILAILEYGYLLVVSKYFPHGPKTSPDKTSMNKVQIVRSMVEESQETSDWRNHFKVVDGWAFIFSFVFFALFNIAYWGSLCGI